MRFHVVTLFPDIIRSYVNESILARASAKKLIRIETYNPRAIAPGKYGRVDRIPYGGGPGMVMEASPVLKAVEKAIGRAKKFSKGKRMKAKVYILSPRGRQFTNTVARAAAKRYTDIILIAGRYEGIDARVKKILKAEELSAGPYVLTGGEVPALMVIDAVARQIRGVLGKEESREEERIASGEVYTRPEILKYKGKSYRVPKVLLSGNHAQINEWRKRR